MATIRKIKVTDLLVNTENYRFEPVGSQKEAINKMINDQGEKLFNLAEHILNKGFNPNDKIQVILSNHDDTKYNVLEGNRRTVAVKLLNHPDLIDSGTHTTLKRKFRKLHDDNKHKLIKDVECTVYNNPAEADTWIKLKHAGQSDGVGTVAWNAQQVQRFEEKVEGKSSIALQAVKILSSSPDVPDDIKSGLPNLKITNLDRLISDPDVRNFLGIEINGGIIQSDVEKKEVIKGLTKITKDLLDPKFNVKKIYTKQDRKDYIKDFPKASKPNTSKKAEKPWQFTGSLSPSPAKPVKPKPNPKDRKTLIPKSCSLKITKPKVNGIYYELLNLDIRTFTNAGGVLFRVFIELSLDCYIEENNLSNTPSAAKSGMDIQQKVFQVANHLETKKIADQAICKGVRFSVKNSNDILGIDTWHAYVHNNRFSPTADNLILTWDSMQDFMTILWNNIK